MIKILSLAYVKVNRFEKDYVLMKAMFFREIHEWNLIKLRILQP
jgi:hypothetical protein